MKLIYNLGGDFDMNILSLFNGLGGLPLACDRANISYDKCYYSEIDKYANKVMEKNYPDSIPLGDVTKWKEWDIDWSSIGLVSAGFPCFAKGSSVMTKMGYKDISEVEIGDLVMTHKNRWKEVITIFNKENLIYKVKAQGLVETETTEEHPYLVSKMFRVNGKRVFSKPDWVEVKDLKVGDFICYPKILNENNPLNLTLDEAYLIGRYIADGHTTMHNRTETGRENERFYNLILSVGSHKIPNTPIKHHLHKHTQSTHRMVFSNKRLVNIVEEYCGRGAKNKVISPVLLELPKDLLEQLVCGLLDGDGSSKDGIYSLTTVSKNLVMSLNLAIMKLYGVVGNITYTERPPKTVICGRTVNQSDTYTLRFTKEVRKQKHYHETDDYFLAPIKGVVETGSFKDVYNIEVDVDNSYTVNNCIVHNCQAWSVAGQQQGDKDERGMLFWTTLEVISQVLKHNPNAKFLMENVKMKKEFEQYITYHTEQALGDVEKILINSALVSAQNRNRYYWTNFKVEQPEDKGILLKDIFTGGIDITESVLKKPVGTSTYRNTWKNMVSLYAKSKCLTASGQNISNASCTNIKISDNVVVRATVQANAEHTYNGKVPTLTAAMGVGGGNVPLLTDNETASQYKGKYIDKNERLKYRKLTPIECERLQTIPEIKKSVIIDFSEKQGKIEWLLEHQRKSVNVGAKYHKLQSSALSAEEKELNQCASAAMSCLSISQADQEMLVQKSVRIVLGECQLQLNYQGKPLLSVNVAELLKKQVHPALEVDIAQEIAGINSILEKILHSGKVGLPVSLKSSTHQESGSSNAERYGQEIELGVKDAKLSAVQDLMDTYTILDHGQNLKTLDLNLLTLFYFVSSVIDLLTLEKIQKVSLLKISIEYSCGFTYMVSNTQRYKMIGNGWTIDVIAHILKHISN